MRIYWWIGESLLYHTRLYMRIAMANVQSVTERPDELNNFCSEQCFYIFFFYILFTDASING